MLAQPFDSQRRIFGGFDLSSTTDLTSLALVQRRDDGGWNANWLTWMPEDNIEAAEKRDAVPYLQWEADGFLRLTPGGRIKHDHIVSESIEFMMENDCGIAGFDPWNAEWIMSHLEQEGIEPIKVTQGYASLSEPSKMMEASIAEGTFEHGKNPIARWCAENVEVQTDTNGNIRPVKPQHGSRKRIDLIVASIIAMAVAIVSDDESPSDGSEFAEDGSLWGDE